MKKEYRSFEDARKFVQSLNFNGKTGWREYCKSGKKPYNIPSAPEQNYKKEWKGWGDWFGTGTSSSGEKKWKTFTDAREFTQSLKLNGQIEWIQYCKSGNKLKDIPSNPYRVYKDKGWNGYGDWLGTENIAPKDMKFHSFEDAKKEARELSIKYNLKTQSDWLKAHRDGIIPKHLPAHPWRVYAKKRKK